MAKYKIISCRPTPQKKPHDPTVFTAITLVGMFATFYWFAVQAHYDVEASTFKGQRIVKQQKQATNYCNDKTPKCNEQKVAYLWN